MKTLRIKIVLNVVIKQQHMSSFILPIQYTLSIFGHYFWFMVCKGTSKLLKILLRLVRLV